MLSLQAAHRIRALLLEDDAQGAALPRERPQAKSADRRAAAPNGTRVGPIIFFLALLAAGLHAGFRSGSFDASASVSSGRFEARSEESVMRKNQKSFAVAAAAALSVGAGAAAQDAVQWRVEDGGNGHWYRLVKVTGGLTWSTAADLCVQAGGHLVTITSLGERNLIAQQTALIPGGGASPRRGWGPWIGASQEAGSSEPTGGWRWVTGEAWSTTFWSPGQPDNLCTETLQVENYLTIHTDLGQTWNDLPLNGCDNDPVVAYWIEFDADCNADGIVDFGQIRAGELEDTNANNVPDCCEGGVLCSCRDADVTGNGNVDAADLAAVLSAWGGAAGGKLGADANRDGIVDAADLAAVLSAWGPCP